MFDDEKFRRITSLRDTFNANRRDALARFPSRELYSSYFNVGQRTGGLGHRTRTITYVGVFMMRAGYATKCAYAGDGVRVSIFTD